MAPTLLVTAVVITVLPRMFPLGVPIRGYGMLLLLASVCGIGLAVHRAQQNRIEADAIFSLAIWMFVCGIAGARLFFVIEYWEVRFANLPFPQSVLEVFMFTEGGLVVYGSLIGASIAFVIFCRRHKLPMLALADMLAPSLVVGLALGRIGCLLNGCCYGGACDAPWAITFPAGSPAYEGQLAAGELHGGIHLAEDRTTTPPHVILYGAALEGNPDSDVVAQVNGHPVASLAGARSAMTRAYWNDEPVTVTLADERVATAPSESQPVHPTQIYSAVNAGLLACITWTFYAFRRRDGEVIGLLLTLYPVSRFVLEQIRIDESSIFDTGLSISQNVSLWLLAGVAVYWAVLLRRPKRLALPAMQ